MKTTRCMEDSIRVKRRGARARRVWLSGLFLFATAAGPARAAINEDEWYDPSDWFDGNNIEYDDTYDYDPYDYNNTGGYDYGYDWDYWGDYYDAYDWDDNDTYSTWDNHGYNSSYWDRHPWNDSRGDASQGDDSVDGTLYSYSIWVPESGQQGQNTSASSQSGSGSEGNKQSGDKQGLARLQGTIEGTKTVQLKRASGARGAFTLAKVKLENGQSTVVNLGRQSELQLVDVSKGDKMEAIGRRGQIEGQAVFVAQKLRVNGKEIDANPAIRLKGDTTSGGTTTVQSAGQSSSGQTSAAKQRMMGSDEEISGKVAGIERLKGTDQSANRTLVKLTLESGKSETVDLGPGAAPEKIGLNKGDSVTVRGRRDQIQGRSVVVAELLKVNGKRMSGASSS